NPFLLKIQKLARRRRLQSPVIKKMNKIFESSSTSSEKK
ncbi:SMIM18 isoform 2, partial [Pan troglodytes]|uniref:Uncharacterized protein n=2 Tax=Pan troglodytes TaxID=9598 RepID=A0A2I3T5G9_PANTR